MSLDIRFKELRPVTCPHCGEFIKHEVVFCVPGGGREWYPILESIGYYVPYEKRTKENDWYGKDMILEKQQMETVYKYIKARPNIYGYEAASLIADAMLSGNDVAVNADW